MSNDDRFRNQFEAKIALPQNPYQPRQERQTGENTLQDTFQSAMLEAEKTRVMGMGALLQISRSTKHSKALRRCLQTVSEIKIMTEKYAILTHHSGIYSYP